MTRPQLQQVQGEAPEPRTYFDGHLLARLCRETLASGDDQTLVERIQRAYPRYPVHLARHGHKWYRLGGVVKPDGARVANDLNEWAERTYLECGQNFDTLLDHCDAGQFMGTKHKGVTLYLAARTGPKAEDFVQIEIDRTQELADRYLIDADQPPGDVEELIDPLEPLRVEPFAVGAARYTYRRKTEVPLFMRELAEHRSEPHPAQRFMEDWSASNAGANRAFCEDWTLRLQQYRGRHGEQVMNVEIVNNKAAVPRLESPEGKKGKALASMISRFDSQAGYPFAWYFYSLKGLVSSYVIEAVLRDISNDHAYIPRRDEMILRRWSDHPYSV